MMRKNKKNAFTLIELIAVLVILAILALIVTPLVLNIVHKAKDSANKRSIDAYGKAVELSIATYLLDNGEFPTNIDQLAIEYTGKEVVCKIQQLNEDSSVYLSECIVGGKEVKDSSTDDGWYHYGKTSATVYQSYKIGDIITYNGMNFYVIENSDENSDSVTLLKAEPLTVDEVNIYGAGHVNRYTYSSVGTATNQKGYGAMAYYSSETCGYVNGSYVYNGCTVDYEKSDIKYVVDAWVKDKIQSSDLSVDPTGYSARLITYEELINNLGYSMDITSLNDGKQPIATDDVPSWAYSVDYNYWTMSISNCDSSRVWYLNYAILNCGGGITFNYDVTVRPVVTLLKNAI